MTIRTSLPEPKKMLLKVRRRKDAMRAQDEQCAGYREKAQAYLQELMLVQHYHPSHPDVTATMIHLTNTTASEAAASCGYPRNTAKFYEGQSLYYPKYSAMNYVAPRWSELEDESSLQSDMKKYGMTLQTS